MNNVKIHHNNSPDTITKIVAINLCMHGLVHENINYNRLPMYRM